MKRKDIASSSLDEGLPCRKHRCIKCCEGTEMPLSESDIKRIEALGYRREDFTVEDRGMIKIRNIKGKCIFLSEYGCSIYEHRPEGCRIYPLVYNIKSKRIELDPECPYSLEFKVKMEDLERLLKLVNKVKRNAGRREDED